jgi:SHS2 domain-containing protein
VGDEQAGHRSVAHTADLRVEAWGPTREECLAQAVAGMVESFLGRRLPPPAETVEWEVPGGSDPDLLAALLDEVIYRAETRGQVPVAVDVAAVPGGLHVRCAMAGTARLEPVGAVPKGVSLHELRCRQDADRWWCSATIDV